jgi:hypothetical protein
MNGKLQSMFACFYLTVLIGKMWMKKIGWKILPKDSKRMRPLQIFGNLAVENYRSIKLPLIWITHAWSIHTSLPKDFLIHFSQKLVDQNIFFFKRRC